MMSQFEETMDSGAMELDADSEHSVAPAADSQGSARMFSRKQRLNVDSILDNSVSSAGEFFSKAIMSFGNHNNHSNQSGGSDSEAICGTSCCGASFNEDQLDFGELARKMPAEYVDWPQGTRPNYGCFKENRPTSSPRAFDVNYKKYDNIEWQNNEEEAAAKAQWFNNTQDLATYGKQAALTWDGRPWSETVEERQFSQMMQMRSRSPFGARRAFVSPEKMSNVYEGGKVCRVCPNSNNSWTYSNEIEVGDVNNNYPNYEMYDRPAPPPQQQRMSAPAAPLPCREDDYAPCIYAPPAAQEHLLARPRPEPPVRSAQRNYSSSYGQMGSPYASESPYFGSSGGSYGYMGYEEPPPPEVQAPREPSPPPVPKIYKVGEIRVRNNVENNDDYAENINRDLGHDESMGFPGGVQFNDLSAYGRAFAFPTSQVLEAPPVERPMERHPPVERQHNKQETRERSHKPRDTRDRSFTNRETKETRKSSSYSHKTYDDTDNGRQWAQERKSLTDIRQKSEESRKRGSKTSDKKPRRSASQGREASYVHRPSAGGDYMRSVKPQPQPREERSFKPERKNHFKKDDKKKEEQPDTQRPGFFRKVARGLRLVN